MSLIRPDTKQWILVTGMIRSGTTFAGKALTLPWSVDYIHEPFNGGYSLPDREPFRPQYISPEADDRDVQQYRRHIAHIFSYDFGLRTARHENDSWLRKIGKAFVGSRGPVYLRIARLNPFHTTSVIKDPTAHLLTEYLYQEFDVQPVIVVRHPVSLAASLDRVGWYWKMNGLLEYPTFVEDHLSNETEFLERSWSSHLLESMAVWRVVYKALLSQAEQYPDWQVVTHERLSAEALTAFQELYKALDLPWSERIKHKIEKLTGGRNSAEARGNQAMDLKRDSANLFEMRRDSVPEDKRREIYDIVKDVALDIYSRESFAID